MDSQELEAVLEELKMIKNTENIFKVECVDKVLKYITRNMNGNHLKLTVDS
jgi:hypothetical protein